MHWTKSLKSHIFSASYEDSTKFQKEEILSSVRSKMQEMYYYTRIFHDKNTKVIYFNEVFVILFITFNIKFFHTVLEY